MSPQLLYASAWCSGNSTPSVQNKSGRGAQSPIRSCSAHTAAVIVHSCCTCAPPPFCRRDAALGLLFRFHFLFILNRRKLSAPQNIKGRNVKSWRCPKFRGIESGRGFGNRVLWLAVQRGGTGRYLPCLASLTENETKRKKTAISFHCLVEN